MSGWAIVVVVAIVVWGLVQMSKSRHGHGPSTGKNDIDGPDLGRDPETDREIEDLRERIKVLERIATDGNSLEVQETKRISAEIEALRNKQSGRGE